MTHLPTDLSLESGDLPSAERAAFEIGWDHAQHRLTPPADHLHAGHPVRQGWEAGRAVLGQRTLWATAHVRKWLQLRLNAWLRGKVFESTQVTPQFLGRIDVPRCPITGELLTHATGQLTDASVDRVNNEAAYAAGNLVVMSTRANRAKSDCDWLDAMGFVRRIEAGRLGQIEGLSASHWARLAVLMSFATPLKHDQAASLPLLLLPPQQLRVINPAQALQVMLTMRFTRRGRAPEIDQCVRLFPAGVRSEARTLLTTLMARRLAAGPAADEAVLRRAMEAAWASPLLLSRWQRLALRLTAADCERTVAGAVRRRLGGSQLRCLSLEQATEGWSLATKGRVATRPGKAGAQLRPRTPTSTLATARPAVSLLVPATSGRQAAPSHFDRQIGT